MKKLSHIALTTLMVLFILPSAFAQKPKKTIDSEKFAKKVKFSFVPQYVNSRAPDAKALEYIAEKTGTPLNEVKKKDEADRISLKEDVQLFSKYGLIFTVTKVEEKIKQSTPIKIADIVMHCATGSSSFELTLENCVQTNISWYLGDGASWKGDVFAGLDEDLAEQEEKENAAEAKQKKEQAEKERREFVRDSLLVARPGWESTITTFEFDESKEALPMEGYYILNSGEKVNAVIAYQKPEFFVGDFAASSQLYICKRANGQKVDLLNPNLESNFDKHIDKSSIKAFYIDGRLYRNYENIGWRIALNEGAIHSFIKVVKITNQGNTVYKSFKQTQKLGGEAYGSVISSIKEEDLLAMMSDAPEIVQNYRDGIRDRYETEIAYNNWFEENHPGKVDYLFGKDFGQAEFDQKYPAKDDTESSNASATPKKDLGLPAEFTGLPGGWKFKSLHEAGKDITASYEEGFLNGNPISIYLEEDNSVLFQKGVRDRRNITYAEWKYLKTEDRDAANPEVDFILILHYNGNSETEKYILVSVSNSELIYESKTFNQRWVWARSE